MFVPKYFTHSTSASIYLGIYNQASQSTLEALFAEVAKVAMPAALIRAGHEVFTAPNVADGGANDVTIIVEASKNLDYCALSADKARVTSRVLLTNNAAQPINRSFKRTTSSRSRYALILHCYRQPKGNESESQSHFLRNPSCLNS